MWAHQLRAFLTVFGIAWGVGSLLLLVGLGECFRAGTEKSLASFGEDYMQIYNGRVPAVGSSQLSSRQYSSTIRIIWTFAALPLCATPLLSSTAAIFAW